MSLLIFIQIFSLYRCRSLENIIPDAVEHPGDIAEPASLAVSSCYSGV